MSSNKFEQKNRKNILTKVNMEILLAVRNGNNGITQLSKQLGKPKSTIFSRLNTLVKMELLKRKDHFYYLTQTGEIACSNLTALPPKKEIKFRLHKYTFTSEISKKSKELEAEFLKGKSFTKAYNFESNKFNTKKDSVTVQFHPKSINCVLPPIFSPNLFVAEACAIQLSNQIIDLVESAFPGTKTGTLTATSHIDDNHLAVVNHPMAICFEKFMQNFDEKYCYKGDKIEIDFSDGEVELEFTDKLNAKQNCYTVADFCNWLCEPGKLEALKKLVEINQKQPNQVNEYEQPTENPTV